MRKLATVRSISKIESIKNADRIELAIVDGWKCVVKAGELYWFSTLGREANLGEEATEELGIVKYEPPVPACLNGEVVGGFPTSVSKTDEERIRYRCFGVR